MANGAKLNGKNKNLEDRGRTLERETRKTIPVRGWVLVYLVHFVAAPSFIGPN